MTIKEELIQEIEQSPEPLLAEVLEFMRSRKQSLIDPVEAYLDELSASEDYADDVTDEELAESDQAWEDYVRGEDPGVSLDEYLSGQRS